MWPPWFPEHARTGKVKTIFKSKENQPFSRQNVVGFYCIGKLHNLKEQLLGRINGEILLLDVLCHVAAKQQGEH